MFGLKNHETEDSASVNTDKEIEEKNFQDKRVNYFKDRYLNDYVDRIEANLRKQGSRITRNEIQGYVLEKISEYRTKNISVTNGNYKLKIAMGDPEELADQFLKNYRKLSPIEKIDKEEIKKKNEEKEYLSSLSTSERIKYKFNKIRHQRKVINSDANPLKYKLHLINVIHIALLIFNIIVTWITISAIINIFQGSFSSRYKLRELSKNAIWSPGNMFFIEFTIFILYFITFFIFRDVKQINYAEKRAKSIKKTYALNFIRYSTQVLLNYIGSWISLRGTPLNNYTPQEVTFNSLISLFPHVLIIITLIKGYNFTPIKKVIEDNIMYNNKKNRNLFSKILYRPLQVAMYFSTFYHFIFANIYYQLFDRLSNRGIDNGLYIAPGVNYSLLVINSLLFAISIILIRFSSDRDKIIAIKKRTRNQSLIQLVLNIVTNAYFYTVYIIFKNASRESELISFDTILTSTIFYYVAMLIILFSIRRSGRKVHE